MPTWVRFAVGLAILGVGVSLAFAFMPDSTTNVRVVAGIVCVACLVFVALVWRRIRWNQEIHKLFKDKGTTTEHLLFRLGRVRTNRTAGKEANRIRAAASILQTKIERDYKLVSRETLTGYRNKVYALEDKIATAARNAPFNARNGIRNLDTSKAALAAAVTRERERRKALRELGGVMNEMGESGFY